MAVDPRTHALTLDGEPITVPPVDKVALSGRYLLG
jgi:urease alpha subunit